MSDKKQNQDYPIELNDMILVRFIKQIVKSCKLNSIGNAHDT